jgi:flagellin FlaB
MPRLMKILHRQQKGITGLETAIILIAFVVVAAVFAYTVLSAGLFSTQKSQEAVYSGLKETQSTMEILGSVCGYKDTLNGGGTGSLGKVEFTLSLASNGDPVDLTPAWEYHSGTSTLSQDYAGANKLQIAYNDQALSLSEIPWTISFIGKNNSDYILENGEKAIITVWLHSYVTGTWADGAAGTFLGDNYVDAYHTFNIEVKPSTGATMTIQRSAPAYLDPVVDLH